MTLQELNVEKYKCWFIFSSLQVFMKMFTNRKLMS